MAKNKEDYVLEHGAEPQVSKMKNYLVVVENQGWRDARAVVREQQDDLVESDQLGAQGRTYDQKIGQLVETAR